MVVVALIVVGVLVPTVFFNDDSEAETTTIGVETTTIDINTTTTATTSSTNSDQEFCAPFKKFFEDLLFNDGNDGRYLSKTKMPGDDRWPYYYEEYPRRRLTVKGVLKARTCKDV